MISRFDKKLIKEFREKLDALSMRERRIFQESLTKNKTTQILNKVELIIWIISAFRVVTLISYP